MLSLAALSGPAKAGHRPQVLETARQNDVRRLTVAVPCTVPKGWWAMGAAQEADPRGGASVSARPKLALSDLRGVSLSWDGNPNPERDRHLSGRSRNP